MTTFINSKALKVALGLVIALAFVASAASAQAYTFTRTLKLGVSNGADVKELQMFLNSDPATMVASAGHVGGPGMETNHFGPATKAGVIKFQVKYGIMPQAGIFGPLSQAKYAALLANGGGQQSNNGCQPGWIYNPFTNPPTLCAGGQGGQQSGPVTAMLAVDNPAAGYYAATQAGAPLLKVTFNGTGTVTTVVLKKIGVASDSSYSNIYLFDGAVRLTDGASVSNNGIITFSNPSGLFTVNGSRTITVKADLNSGGSEVVGASLYSFTTLGSTTPVMVTTVTGNQFSLVSASGLAQVALVSGTATPSAANIDPQNDYVVWQNNLNVSSREAKLVSAAFREVGSINYGDVNNFRLMVDGQIVATTQSIDANGYVTFVPATPVTLSTNTHVVKVMADVVGGAYRNFKFEVRNKVDLNIIDSQSGYGISVTGTIANSAGVQTINNGNVTVQKAANSPSGDVIYNGNDVVLARYTLRTFGEAVKIDTIKASVTLSSGTGGLRSGRILIDGQQVGSTATLAEDSAGTPYTTYNANYTLQAGSTATLEIRADLYETGAGAAVAAGVTAVANLEDVGSMLNAQGVSSGQTFDLPTSDVTGNTLTVRSGTATVAKYTAYANQTTVAPKTSYLIGKWALTAGTVEDVNLDTFSFAMTYADAFADADLNNVMIKVDGQQVSTTKSTVSSPFSYSANVMIPKGTTKYLELYADILSSATDGDATPDTAYATLTASGTTTPSGASVTPSAAPGQTITASTGSFSTGLDGTSPVNRAVSGNQTVTAAAYKFTATNETYSIKEVQVKVSSAAVASVISAVQLYDGATPVGMATPFNGATATISLSQNPVPVAANSVKVLTAKLMLNNIGQGAGTSQSNAALTLDYVKYFDSQGVETTDNTDRAGNELYVYKAVPTFTQGSVDTATTVVNGSQRDLFKFSVTAPSSTISANGITLKNIRLPITWNDAGTGGDALEVESVKLLVDGSDVTTSDVTLQDDSGNSVESTSGLTEADAYLVISWDAGKELSVGAGQTREIKVRGTFQGFNALDADSDPTDSVGFNLLADTAHNGTKVYLNGTGAGTIWGLHTSAAATGSGTAYAVIWSDVSANPHATAENASSSDDWANSYKLFDDMDVRQFED